MTNQAGAIVIAIGAYALGCGPSPAAPPGYVVVVPVPPERVVATCPCDDDEDDDEVLFARRSIDYVSLDAWQPPPSVQRFEAVAPPRGEAPPTYIHYPELKLHQPIPGTTMRRGWWR
jgi:hypothetical protein